MRACVTFFAAVATLALYLKSFKNSASKSAYTFKEQPFFEYDGVNSMAMPRRGKGGGGGGGFSSPKTYSSSTGGRGTYRYVVVFNDRRRRRCNSESNDCGWDESDDYDYCTLKDELDVSEACHRTMLDKSGRRLASCSDSCGSMKDCLDYSSICGGCDRCAALYFDGSSCRDHYSCRSGYCRSGKCTQQKSQGQHCDEEAQCKKDTQCSTITHTCKKCYESCNTKADCVNYKSICGECDVCNELVADGGFCIDHYSCRSGYCRYGQCTQQNSEGENCDEESQCEKNTQCSTSTLTCKKCYESCNTKADCLNYMSMCEECDVCNELVADGGFCVNHYSCRSGYCRYGTCTQQKYLGQWCDEEEQCEKNTQCDKHSLTCTRCDDSCVSKSDCAIYGSICEGCDVCDNEWTGASTEVNGKPGWSLAKATLAEYQCHQCMECENQLCIDEMLGCEEFLNGAFEECAEDTVNWGYVVLLIIGILVVLGCCAFFMYHRSHPVGEDPDGAHPSFVEDPPTEERPVVDAALVPEGAMSNPPVVLGTVCHVEPPSHEDRRPHPNALAPGQGGARAAASGGSGEGVAQSEQKVPSRTQYLV